MSVKIENLSVSFDGKPIIENLSFEVCDGETIGIKGENGSGKSTLCLCIAGLLEYGEKKGRILFDGKDVEKLTQKERCGRVGIVFQNAEDQLIMGTVEDELAFAPENLGVEREEIGKRIDDALKMCGILHLKKNQVSKLSYGEKQLVAVASVLTMRPKLLIADEISASVDKAGRIKLKQVLLNFKAEGGSVIFVSHNASDLDAADRVITLKRA